MNFRPRGVSGRTLCQMRAMHLTPRDTWRSAVDLLLVALVVVVVVVMDITSIMQGHICGKDHPDISRCSIKCNSDGYIGIMAIVTSTSNGRKFLKQQCLSVSHGVSRVLWALQETRSAVTLHIIIELGILLYQTPTIHWKSDFLCIFIMFISICLFIDITSMYLSFDLPSSSTSIYPSTYLSTYTDLPGCKGQVVTSDLFARPPGDEQLFDLVVTIATSIY